MITTNLTGNLGNHMWQYSACRSVAEKLGFRWGINSKPSHDYHSGMNQMYFMDVDFGDDVSNINHDFYENWTTIKHNGIEINITFLDPNVFNIKDNTRLLGKNGAFGGLFQTDRYFESREKIISWFKIKNEFEIQYQEKLKNLGISLDENLCVINFRGGEYRGIPHVVCRKEYWKDSIDYMKSLNPKMDFLIISDDPDFANQYMPFEIKSIHVDIGFDFYVVNKSKWTIISNSSFGWWASYLNTCSNKIIAPKYFSCHNFSDGFWCLGESFTKNFYFMDRNGVLSDSETEKKDAIEYYKNKNIPFYENL
jgi:hypothetical protein